MTADRTGEPCSRAASAQGPPAHRDDGYLAMTEVTTMQALNEDLQRRLGMLEMEKGELISANGMSAQLSARVELTQ